MTSDEIRAHVAAVAEKLPADAISARLALSCLQAELLSAQTVVRHQSNLIERALAALNVAYPQMSAAPASPPVLRVVRSVRPEVDLTEAE